MLNKSSLAEFVKKHSFAIELSFLLAFVALYFVPLAHQVVLGKYELFFNFHHFSILKYEGFKNPVSYTKNILLGIFLVLPIMISIILFICKKRYYASLSLIYLVILISDNLFFLDYLFGSKSFFTDSDKTFYISIYIILLFFIILMIYRIIEYIIGSKQLPSKLKKIITKKKLSQKQRIEKLEKEIEELKKGNQE